jgi:hypothetical protein
MGPVLRDRVERNARWQIASARCLAIASVSALALAVGASSANASVTVGQIAPSTPTPTCASPVDRVQLPVIDGNSYVVPANGTITSWSTNAGTSAGELKMKVFRKVAGSVDTYTVVGHDGPRTLAVSSVNTFASSVAVKTGDVLGLNSFSGLPNCSFVATGDSYLRTPAPGGDLGDGASGSFSETVADRRLNISAVLDPSNTLTFGQLVRNKKKGTATLTVNVPNAGQLDYSGTSIKIAETAAVKTVTAAGPLKFRIKATGKKKRKLNETGKVKVKPRFTFTPTGGTARTQSRKLKLKKL